MCDQFMISEISQYLCLIDYNQQIDDCTKQVSSSQETLDKLVNCRLLYLHKNSEVDESPDGLNTINKLSELYPVLDILYGH